MATVNWPSDLPTTFLDAGISYGPKPNTVVTAPEAGPVRTRRRSTERIILFRGSMVLFKDARIGDRIVDQLVAMQNFHHTTLKDGSLRFNWRDPVERDVMAEMLIVEFPPAVANYKYGVRAMVQTLGMEIYRS